MPRINEYPNTMSVGKMDAFVIDGYGGTRSIEGQDLLWALIETGELTFSKRVIYRGNYLGDSVLPEQRTVIQNGSFNGLFLGDFWDINGVVWRIEDFDYWYGIGDAETTPGQILHRHHVVIMPDTVLGTARMNATNDATGGYYKTSMITQGLLNANAVIQDAFYTAQGNVVLTHPELFMIGLGNGRPTLPTWIDSRVDIPNEPMMYGSYMLATPGTEPTGDYVTYRYTSSKTQLALFQLCPRFIQADQAFWLRDVVSAENYAAVGLNGETRSYSASTIKGVRPVFAIG